MREFSPSHESRVYGRGGAGNFDAQNHASRQRDEVLKKQLESIHEVAAKRVENGLQKPVRAIVRHPEEEYDTV